MSLATVNSIAETTRALHLAIEEAVKAANMKVTVTNLAPDVAREQQTGNQVNIFLYQLTTNAAWRNEPLRANGSHRASAQPAIGLNLQYLITAYDATTLEEEEVNAHTLLGCVIGYFHSRPALDLSATNLVPPREAVRITWQPLSLDEMTKIWSSLQAPFRCSALYEVAPILIEHQSSSPAPLPVLRRGDADRGWNVATIFAPAIDSIEYLPKRELDEMVAGRRPLKSRMIPKRQFGARLGGGLVIRGSNLVRPENVQVEFIHTEVEELVDERLVKITRRVAPSSSSRDHLLVDLSAAIPGDWPSGVYQVRVRYIDPSGHELATGVRGIQLVPRITSIRQLGVTAAGERRFLLSFAPPVRTGQSPTVFVGEREFVPEVGELDNELIIELEDEFPPQDTHARVRVGGVDSLLFDPDAPADENPEFLDAFKIEA